METGYVFIIDRHPTRPPPYLHEHQHAVRARQHPAYPLPRPQTQLRDPAHRDRSPLITVKELLGHSNIMITENTYTHALLPYRADALRLLDLPTRLIRRQAKWRAETQQRGRNPQRARTADHSNDHDP